MQKSIIDIVKKKYPELAAKVELIQDGNQITGEIPFHNPRYRLWFADDGDGYIVGINFLHSHFDCDTQADNLNAALKRIDQILRDEIVAIGNRGKSKDYIVATMDKQEAFKRYDKDDPRIEIVSFSKEY